MGLTHRVTAYVATVMLALSVVLVAAAASAMLLPAMRTDDAHALEGSFRAQGSFEGRLDALRSSVVEWSVGDDTYDFMRNPSSKYVSENLSAGTFKDLDVNVVALYDRAGKLRHVVARDRETLKRIELPRVSSVLELNPPLNLAKGKRKSSGAVVRIDEDRLMLVGVARILPSDKKGRARGTMLMGRLLDENEITALARESKLNVSLAPISEQSFGDEPVRTVNDRTITVAHGIQSPTGVPLANLAVVVERSSWNSATRALSYLGLIIVALVVVTILLMRLGLGRIVLERLSNLDRAVGRIRSTGRAETLRLPGNDEISSLAKNVDGLVVELASAREKVEDARCDLELRVEERTAELSRAVSSLQSQIQRREVAEAGKEASEQRYETLIENLSDVVFTITSDCTLLFVSSAVTQVFGATAEGVVGCNLSMLIGDKATDLVKRRIRRGILPDGAHLPLDGCVSIAGPIDLDLVITPLRDGRGFQGILRDITARRRYESELLHMASHDFLTGLWNRRRFEEELSRTLAELGRGGRPGAVLWLDLDGFKDVNDTLGHKAGDELLTAVAQRLSRSVRADCVVARLGGDEFAVLMPDTSEEAALAAGERLLAEIGSVAADVEGRIVRASTSLGVVLYPQHGIDVEELLARADMAMYRAKELGRSRCVLFDPVDEWRNGIEDRLVWTEMVELALAEGGLVAFAQPIRDVASGGVASYELLVRIRDFQGEFIMPDRFLPVAERTGMIVDIDLWMLQSAVRILEANPDERHRINVNASTRTISDPRFLEELTRLVTTSDMDPARLVIEVTETAIIVDVASVNDTLHRIKALGCRVALDDFGSGFTSFLHLKQLPVDDIKIDGSFVQSVCENTNDQHLVRAMVEMAKGLDMHTTAEFVESTAILELLTEYGVEYVQGFVVGEPQPVEDVLGSCALVAPNFRMLA